MNTHDLVKHYSAIIPIHPSVPSTIVKQYYTLLHELNMHNKDNSHNSILYRRLFSLKNDKIKINISKPKIIIINDGTHHPVYDRPSRIEVEIDYYYPDNSWVLTNKISQYQLLEVKAFAKHNFKVKLHIDYRWEYPFKAPHCKLINIENNIDNDLSKEDNFKKAIKLFDSLDHGCEWSPVTSISTDILSLIVTYINYIENNNI